MAYPSPAIAPEFAEQQSIYPVGINQRRAPVLPEESLDSRIELVNRGLPNGGVPWFNLQHRVPQESSRLGAERRSQKPPSFEAAAPTSGNTAFLDQGAKDKNGKGKISDGNRHDGDIVGELEDLNTDLTMFEGIPKYESLVSETERIVLPPLNLVDVTPPSTLGSSSMVGWKPELDPEFQKEALWHRDHGGDFSFKVPETPSDIESLQQALEITRMDFWVRCPFNSYPDLLAAQHQGESYASQHWRLQHAFRRIWEMAPLLGSRPAPALYRLPGWVSGFDARYWTPYAWGVDDLSRAYYGGLVMMADEKNAKGRDKMNIQEWKNRLKGYALTLDINKQEAKTKARQSTGSRAVNRGPRARGGRKSQGSGRGAQGSGRGSQGMFGTFQA